ncbi:MAG: hypothetical protein LBR79_05550 [Oscillospiraceae bacterium]|nr:hypothetical protein [Oscillospiraceae bacterium]
MWPKLVDNIFSPRLRRGEKEEVSTILRHNPKSTTAYENTSREIYGQV